MLKKYHEKQIRLLEPEGDNHKIDDSDAFDEGNEANNEN